MSGFLDSISGSISEAPYIIKCLTVFLLSMIPVTELRLALPFGIVIGLDYPSAMLFSFLGNIPSGRRLGRKTDTVLCKVRKARQTVPMDPQPRRKKGRENDKDPVFRSLGICRNTPSGYRRMDRLSHFHHTFKKAA